MGSLLRLLGGRRRAVGGGDISAASLDELVSTIASTWTATNGPQAGGTFTINSVSLGSYDYVVVPGGTTISSFEAASYFTDTADSRFAIIVAKGDLTINDAVIPGVRKLGCIIGASGTITGTGSVSMTARGADHSAATGSNVTAGAIRIYTGLAGGVTNPQVPAAGGAGAVCVVNKTIHGTDGTSGGTGGGGSGFTGGGGGDLTMCNGTAGTCYSGGSGGGDHANLTGGTRAGTDGGPGGDGRTTWDSDGGAGNPGGSGNGPGDDGDDGTGGLLYIICATFAGTLTLSADGSEGGNAGASGRGGGSGGGGVHVLCDTDSSSATLTATGGLAGIAGDGGDGTTRIMVRGS